MGGSTVYPRGCRVKTFQPIPSLLTFYNTLIAQASAEGQFVPPPVIPARPDDPQQAAFLDHLCMPLHGLLKNAYDRAQAVIAQQYTNPYAVDPYTGQPYHPEAWGTTAGSP